LNDDIDRMIETFEAAIRDKADYAIRLVDLGSLVAAKDAKVKALELARKALEVGRGDPQVAVRAGKLLAKLIPGYHVPMMNDARRNAAWDAALRRAIRPGMRVFEIGTGAGMLAMMAARAGSTNVVTCETNEVAAVLARELVARNGLADRIRILTKPSQEVTVGADLEGPADLLFCDIFGDALFRFSPLPALADARRRLLAPGAPSIPAGGMLRAALAYWPEYGRLAHIETACDFDLRPMSNFARTLVAIDIGDPGLRLASRPQDLFCFDFAEDSYANEGRAEIVCKAEADGVVNGISCWIKLVLDAQTTLEARPEPGAKFFSRTKFAPLPEPLTLRSGDELRVAAAYNGNELDVWLAGKI